jgi:hypothetical protein
MDLVNVIEGSSEPSKLNVGDRVKLVAGDLFSGEGIESHDAYMMKHILHDWNDDEVCNNNTILTLFY